MTRLLRLLLDTTDERVMSTSLKRIPFDWAVKAGICVERCGLLRRLRSSISLCDDLCSSELVVEPVKAFGRVVSDSRKGSFCPDKGELSSSACKKTRGSAEAAGPIAPEADDQENEVNGYLLDDLASSASSTTGLLTDIEPVQEIDGKGNMAAMTSTHLKDALVVNTRTKANSLHISCS